MPKKNQLIIPLPNGCTLRCDKGVDYEWGSAVRICDKNGKELHVWTSDEWEQEGEGESVMGAIFSAALLQR